MEQPSPRYPEGRQPWDPINGVRVGGLVGALIGGGVAAILGAAAGWLIGGGAALGAAVGYFDQKRRLRP